MENFLIIIMMMTERTDFYDDEIGDELLAKHSVTKSELCEAYNISFVTLRRWFKLIGFTEEPFFGRKGFSRGQVVVIFERLGRP